MNKFMMVLVHSRSVFPKICVLQEIMGFCNTSFWKMLNAIQPLLRDSQGTCNIVKVFQKVCSRNTC